MKRSTLVTVVVSMLALSGCDRLRSDKPSIAELERCARALELEAVALERVNAPPKTDPVATGMIYRSSLRAWNAAMQYRDAACAKFPKDAFGL